VIVNDLDEARLRLLRLALNRLGEESSWDLDALKLEFSDVLQITSDIDLRISGFEMGEIDVALSATGEDEEDVLPALEAEPPISKPGDLWALGDHRLLCGDALDAESYARLLGDERAQMVFTDPPWNIPIAFPIGRHDDQVDSVSQFLCWWQKDRARTQETFPVSFAPTRPREWWG
jgi:hypothetical protein